MYFDADYLEHATLRDGTEVVLRLVKAEDKVLLREGFARLSPESRYRRFFTPKSELSADELRYLTECDQVRHLAIGAASSDLSRGLGVARCIALTDDPGAAEAAVAVTDDMQGRGLGSLLLQRLIAAARERGIERFRFEMLGTNKGMADLVRALAPTASSRVEDGVLRMELVLPGLAPRHPASEPPRESGLYRLMSMMARGALEWRALWRQLGEVLSLGGRAEPSSDHDSIDAHIASGGHPIETAAAGDDVPEADEPS